MDSDNIHIDVEGMVVLFKSGFGGCDCVFGDVNGGILRVISLKTAYRALLILKSSYNIHYTNHILLKMLDFVI